MTIAVDLKAKGVYINPNPLEIKEGAMISADNCIIDRDDTTEQRRGFARYGTTIVGKQLFNYKKTLLVYHGTSLGYDSDSAGTWSDYSGSYSPPTGNPRILSFEANKNFYFMTSLGVKKLDAVAGPVMQAGAPKGLDGTAALTGSSGFMTDNSQVAYRIVWGYMDANSNKILGSPSQRIIISNTVGGGATRNVIVTFSIPSGVTTANFYQIYRSGITVTSTTTPNDELQLIAEKKPTSGEITALAVAYTDITPESLRGATLYTSPSQQGILQANEAPPLAKDAVVYKQMSLYANTTSKHRLNLTLIAVGASSGIQVDDTITIAGQTYTGKAAENAAAKQFLVDTGGTPAANIDSTSKSLIRVINQYSGNTTVYAYYMSGYTDLPGQILVEERNIGGSQFTAASSRGGAFSPALPASGSSYGSANDVAKNRIYISKTGQPEAVPLLQYLECGNANKDILRIKALRDSVFVLKEDGLFRIIGEDPSTLRVSLFDSTTELLNIDSAVAFNNQVYGLTTQGITAMSDSGVAIVSRPIEAALLQISASQYTNFNSASFGVAYESDRKFILATVVATTDTYSTQQWVYNSLTTTFSRWTLKCAHAIVGEADNKLYYCNADPNVAYIMKERKAFDNTDYADDDLPMTISAFSGKTVTVASSATASVGWTLSDGTRSSVITSIPNTTQLVVADEYTWDLLTGKIYKPISCLAKWWPQHGGDPVSVKHFAEVLFYFRNATFDKVSASYNTDMSAYDETGDLIGNFNATWGNFQWGNASWGGKDVFLQTIRTLLPRDKSRGRWLNISLAHAQALANFALAGVSIDYEAVSTRSK